MNRIRTMKYISAGIVSALVVTFTAPAFPASGAAQETALPTSSATYDKQFVSERISNNYTKVSGRYTVPVYSGDDLVFSFTENSSDNPTYETMGYNGSDTVADFLAGDVNELRIDVPQTAQYAVRFDYLSYDNSVLPVEFSMALDESGNYPFYECRNVKLRSTWIPKAEKSYDRYNDEVVTVPDKAIQWESAFFTDSSARRSEALLLELTEGVHYLHFEVNPLKSN